MIFSNKIYKISSGKNISLFAEDENTMTLYVNDNKIKKRKIIFSGILRCLNKSTNIDGSYVKKINQNHTFVCHDDNILVISNEEN